MPKESLIAWVPINARKGGATDTEGQGNNITAMTTAIYTDEADPLERLRRIMKSTRASKEAKSGMSARLMTDLTKHIPAATQVLTARLVLASGVAARSCNLFVSNVPGPQEALYMNGARVWGSYGLAPLGDGMGLFIATPSYNGKMTFNVISTREIMPDIRFFVECLERSMAELQNAAGALSKLASKKKAPVKKATKKKVAAKKAPKKPGTKKKAAAKKAPKKLATRKKAATKRAPRSKK